MKSLPKVLLVEDQLSIQKIVEATLGSDYALVSVNSLAAAESELHTNSPALLILDVGLPDGDGFDFCEKLRSKREFNNLSIIFLTGCTEIDSRVKGLSLGGDDYVTKPLEPKEFLARVEAQIRRTRRTQGQTSFLAGTFRVDQDLQKIFVRGPQGEDAIDLTPIEFKLLLHFLKNEGKVFSRAELIGKIWGGGTYVSEHTVDTHISTLRKKIGHIGQYLKAVVKRGYCFDSEKRS